MIALNEQLEKCISRARNAFNRGITRSVEFRVQQLQALNRCIEENRELWMSVIKRDLMKPHYETVVAELGLTQLFINEMLLRIKDHIKPKLVFKSFLMRAKAFTVYEPYGVALIISPWNYPVQLTLLPLIGAIAAGNCAIVKPSELSHATSSTMARLLPKYLDQDCYHIIEGDARVAQCLLEEKFDYIFFTGSTKVGRIVAQAAAKNLTPTTLELGGKSPVYLDHTVPDMEIACKRLLFGKFHNAGQVCVAPDYLLCTPEVEKQFVDSAHKVIKDCFGDNPKESKDFGRIVNEMHFKRLSNLIKSSGRIAIGGDTDAQQRYIAPTILVDVTPNDPIMAEEIFGPVLPIINVSSADEAIEFVRRRDKPLSLYVFTTDNNVIEKFLNKTSSGNVVINDTIIQTAIPDLPFGGVGASGMGRYRWKSSFSTFSNEKSVLIKHYNNPLLEYIEDYIRSVPMSELGLRVSEFFWVKFFFLLIPYHWRNFKKYSIIGLICLLAVLLLTR